MSVDVDYQKRLDWLADLVLQNPKKRIRDLQRESLKYYPLGSQEAVRNWMSMKTAFAAADLANKKAGLEIKTE